MASKRWMVGALAVLMSLQVLPGASAEDLLTGTVSGLVTNEQGSGLGGVCVAVYQDRYESAAVRVTGEDGAYVINDLSPGDYKVHFNDCGPIVIDESPWPGPRPMDSRPVESASDYLDEWWNDKSDFDSADSVAVNVNAVTTNIDAALALGGSVSGRVTNEQGGGLCAFVSAQAETWHSTQTTDGYYRITGLRTGDYRLQFSDCESRHGSEWFNDKPNFESADLVPVVQAVETSGIDAVLSLLPRVDLVVTAIEVEKVPIETDYGTAGYSGWMRKIHVKVSNIGEATPEYAWLAVSVCAKTTYRCNYLDGQYVDTASGSHETFTIDWNGFGTLGDVRIEAELEAFRDVNFANNFRTANYYVIAGGTGLGL